MTDEIPPLDLVACPRCKELVVTVEMRLPATVYWRCVRCGRIFVQRLARPDTRPLDEAV